MAATAAPGVASPTGTPTIRELERAVKRRRTFAIISHPDAGKTTLTEKLLLYGGAIHLAGSVKSRRAERHATSDWMKLEQERGISITSSVMQFEYAGYQINLLDTPGHEDFSEDTYRTLIAADSAVMLLDNRKGVEARTRQLFEVCKMRRTPIFTFVNKCDRVGEDPLRIISDVEADLGINCFAVTWPVFRDGTFVGVYDRLRKELHIFERDKHHGAGAATVRVGSLDNEELRRLLGNDALEQLQHDVSLLDEAGHVFDAGEVATGKLTPVFFGSALTNFGVEPFLREFLELAPAPGARESDADIVEPTRPDFSGFVFKIQANMDPRHRDRIAFLRVVSGRFVAGMSAVQSRTAKVMRLAAPQQFLARERTAVESAWPGDVVGIMDKGTLRIGDTLCEQGSFSFSNIPRFAPEHFARATPVDPLRRKQFDAGLRQLTEEGTAQLFYADSEIGPSPIVGAVGLLQFDVMAFRLENEYRAPCRFERMEYRHPRWVTGPESAIDNLARERGHLRLFDAKGNVVVLFENDWALRRVLKQDNGLTFHEVAP